jgi:hypothetical protein
MKTVFVFDRVAVVVQPWWEPFDPPERGARIEVRLLADEPRRGTRFAAQRITVDTPIWRADLFDQTTSPAGNLRSAHFHPRFQGVEPCDRVWDDAIKADPLGWLSGELGDLQGLAERALPVGPSLELDADAMSLRDALAQIVVAIRETWARVRSEPEDASGHRSTASTTSPG